MGSTLHYVSQNNSGIKAYSCEPNVDAYEFASNRIEDFDNVELFNNKSPDMLYNIVGKYPEVPKKNTVFWLDAHGFGYKWSLLQEISFISERFRKGYIFIDDFKVPGMECFKWEKYEDQECFFEYIKESINKGLNYSLYYPTYSDRTSTHHPLTGWAMIEFGHEVALSIPKELENKIRRVT